MRILKKYAQIFIAVIFLGVSAIAGAANILFAHVDNTGPYVDDGNRIRDMLTAPALGHTVTTRFLDAAVYNDFNTFDLIFVYDLYTGLDNEANQLANYQGIANWYNGLTNKNLILDGRIISSATPWVNPPETAWIQNYAAQLDSRGGGLFLGTDHATPGQTTGVFVDGINTINSLIGVNPFNSFFGGPQALVDSQSPFFLNTLANCSAAPTEKCINDNSTTSFAPAGLQPNGQFLTPVAYHGTTSQAFDQAAVSSTIGSPTFQTCDDGSPPPCVGTVPEPSVLFLFAAGLFGLDFSRRRILG